jgi:long-chain acyl-CoA synthetase
MIEASAPQANRPWFAHYDANVPHTLELADSNIPGLLLRACERWPNNTALIFGRRRIVYREMYEHARRLAGVLRGLGVEKGDRVAIMLPNCPQFAIVFFGVLLAGGIAVPTSPLYTAREAESQLKNSGAKVVVALGRLAPLLKQVADAAGLRHVILTSLREVLPLPDRWLARLVKAARADDARIADDRFKRWGALLSDAEPIEAPVPVNATELAVLQYTGGTTGVSKGAMLTHRNLVANCTQVNSWLARSTAKNDVYLGVTPFFHIYALTTVVLSAVAMGGAVVCMPRFDVDKVLRAIQKYRPTIFHGVPTMYVAINRAAEKAKVDFSSVEACISGSAPLPVAVQQRFESLTGGRLVEGYGLSEASPVTHINPMRGTRKIGSIGLPVPNTDCKIVELANPESEVPIGETGILAVRGPQVMQGYWQTPKETAQVLRDGWLYTGDIARVDEDGFFYVVDRQKDMIIAGGFKVYPREVEEVLLTHPSVEEAVVIGAPDEYRGECVKAFLVLKQGAVVDEEELRTFARGRLAPYKVFRSLEICESLPKTAAGKVLRRLLREGKS